MVEAALQEETTEKKRSFKKIILLAINALLFLSGVAFFALTKMGMLGSPPATDANAAGKADMMMQPCAQSPSQGQASAMDKSTPQAMVPGQEMMLMSMKPFVVNLSGDRGRRYLRVAIEMEVMGEMGKEKIEERMTQVRNLLIFLLSKKRLEDISRVEGKYALQEEISQQVNEILGAPLVKKTYFTDFIVQ